MLVPFPVFRGEPALIKRGVETRPDAHTELGERLERRVGARIEAANELG